MERRSFAIASVAGDGPTRLGFSALALAAVLLLVSVASAAPRARPRRQVAQLLSNVERQLPRR